MNVALIMTAVKLGAVVANYCEVMALHKDHASGKVVGARVRDNISGEEWSVRAKVRLNASSLLDSRSRRTFA
jgi:glycerol-3-phosphate dehydrogenase